MKKLLSTTATLALVTLATHAQNYSIDWFKIAGGGGSSTGGPFALSGTAGQPDAGSMSGGNYSLTGGFWSLISAAQSPGSPLLMIKLTGTNSVVVSWPSPSIGFTLQQNSNLNTTNWVTAPQSPADDGTTRSIIVNPPTGSLFFRLKH
jgi:hypothetical protein